MDKTALCDLVGIDWDTVGRICDRVVAHELDPGRLDDLFDIGVDEVSEASQLPHAGRRPRHQQGRVGPEGRDAKTLDGFFDEIGEARSGQMRTVSMDMGPAFRKSVTADGHAPQATIHDLLRPVPRRAGRHRRAQHRPPRPLAAATAAARPRLREEVKGARWALLKNPEDLTDRQAQTLAAIRRNGGALWRASQRKEELRAIFAVDDLTDNEVADMLDRWCARVQRSRPAAPSANTATGSSPRSGSDSPTRD